MELEPNAHSPSQNENWQKLLRNSNWTFPAVHHFTWNLKFASNILSMTEELKIFGYGESETSVIIHLKYTT